MRQSYRDKKNRQARINKEKEEQRTGMDRRTSERRENERRPHNINYTQAGGS